MPLAALVLGREDQMKLTEIFTIKTLPPKTCVYCEKGTIPYFGVPIKLADGTWGHLLCCVQANKCKGWN
jgi:hypothetical protein